MSFLTACTFSAHSLLFSLADFEFRLARVNTLIANLSTGKQLDVDQLPSFADFVMWRDAATGDTLLHRAVTSGDNRTVAALLALPKSATLLQHANVAGRVPLLEAVRCNNVVAIDALLKAGADPSALIKSVDNVAESIGLFFRS